jgi:hypothetical protein
MAIKICIDELEVENFEINKADIIIKFGILKFKLNKEKLKKIISNNKSKIKLEVNDFKEIIKKIEIPKLNINAKFGTGEPNSTAFFVAIVSSIIGIALARKIENPRYTIEPVYGDMNYIFLSINCIFEIKLVHIINIFIKLKRKEYQKYGRTPNRRSYVGSNG